MSGEQLSRNPAMTVAHLDVIRNDSEQNNFTEPTMYSSAYGDNSCRRYGL